MSITGPRLGPRLGPLMGPSPSFDTSTPTIYGYTTAAEVNTYLQGLLGVGDNLTPAYGWNFDGQTGTETDFIGGVALDAISGAATDVSPHGRAAGMAPPSAVWQAPDSTALDMTTVAFAILARVRFNAAPGAPSRWCGKGVDANPHYGLMLSDTGRLGMRAKQSGAPTRSFLADPDLADGEYRWVLGGRTVIDQALVFATATAAGQVAFAAAKDLTNTTNSFALAAFDLSAAMDMDTDHLLIFTGAVAETLLPYNTTLLTLLDAAG